jgi:hypothetical protein
MSKLLSRDTFRHEVFNRDKHLCVICKAVGKDAHHIIDRKLWPDGGYYLENGATVCEACHILAEQTVITCEEIREAAGIKDVLLPVSFDIKLDYDKWGKVMQKRYKYPKTLHLPWSLHATSDDKMHMWQTIYAWDHEVIVTEKRDGENSTLYNDYYHARSIDSNHHASRNQIKAIHGAIQSQIPEGWRICGENLTAMHSIQYDKLKSYFEVFSIWEGETCFGWDDTVVIAQSLGLETVPVLFRGVGTVEHLMGICNQLDLTKQEGYVVRPSASFERSNFQKMTGKFVRENHVQTDEHWMFKPVVYNGLE